ncbi:thiol-disulfide oxidoreductase [Shewanella sairae]|uniref:Thiol-disulfide oxidoreductase n=1 Tax=Shewanella sairae TaxID=190310 RepID=A0ABQ4PL50_9GAMM|nr:DCC1-like thiol-disulfide oxidoreductase family protein [Shewanella sairae]MCL1128941.1 DCC1-like thiol-disulfide oxidoreductase family protein [Shewanella sairae]GIU48666.1 thiol-disulfide oxidoreductase [Shewanella sairae]
MQKNTEQTAVVIFDGVCNLCDGAVSFIVRHAPNASFRFVALQSPEGKLLLAKHQLVDIALDSVILLKQQRYYLRSDAVIEIAKSFTGMAAVIKYVGILPKGLRDGAYNLLAKHRYRLFGKKDLCGLPSNKS